MLVVQILFWVLLIVSFIFTWPGAAGHFPPWSAHVIYLVLFVCLGLATFGGGLVMIR
jgi:hypothetical protein